MATKPLLRRLMFEQGLLQELLHFNIAQGSSQSRCEVRDLLCLLTLNNPDAVDCLNQKLMESVDGVLKRSGHSLALLNSIRHEMALFAASLQCQDTCWEKRLRSVVQLFLKSTHHLQSPAVMDVITLPCLRIIQELIQGNGLRLFSSNLLGH
jgi:E3 ubiquitin-protein ligase UBR4